MHWCINEIKSAGTTVSVVSSWIVQFFWHVALTEEIAGMLRHELFLRDVNACGQNTTKVKTKNTSRQKNKQNSIIFLRLWKKSSAFISSHKNTYTCYFSVLFLQVTSWNIINLLKNIQRGFSNWWKRKNMTFIQIDLSHLSNIILLVSQDENYFLLGECIECN